KPSPHAGRRISGIVASSELSLGDEVAFVGCTSGFSYGRITALEVSALVVGEFQFDGCIEVEAKEGRFSQPGDGGALVYRVSDSVGIGMILASAKTDDNRHLTYLLPLGPTLEAFGAQLMES